MPAKLRFGLQDPDDFDHWPWLHSIWRQAPTDACVSANAFLNYHARASHPLANPVVPEAFRPRLPKLLGPRCALLTGTLLEWRGADQGVVAHRSRLDCRRKIWDDFRCVMPVTHMSRRGQTYYLHTGPKRGGGTQHFFSTKL